MAKLDVLKFPNSLLKKRSSDLKDVGHTIRDLAEDMFETMYAENGIGLAAPQIGELIRLIVIDVPKEDEIDPEKLVSDPVALINPEIISHQGDIEFEEGCLSCPELIVKVPRHDQIKVRYLDLEGQPSELICKNLKSVCIQHEIDHLNGTLLTDRITRIEKDLYKSKRIKIAKSEKDLEGII
jgi:peptide deformylase